MTGFCAPSQIQDVEDNVRLVEPSARQAVSGEASKSLVLGGAHVGLLNILKFIAEEKGVDSLDTVIGGTHLSGADPEDLPLWMETLRRLLLIRRWRVNHCTGFKAAALLSKNFDDVDWAGVGVKLTF